MSESAWQSRAELPPSGLPAPFRPELVIGAASPLWAYFTGAAMAGVAFWCMSRLMRPQDVEATAETVAKTELALVDEAENIVADAVEPTIEVAARAAGGPVGEALAREDMPVFPVGGEAAPFGAATLEAELISDPELAADLTPPPAAAAPTAAAPRATAPRTRKPREGGDVKSH